MFENSDIPFTIVKEKKHEDAAVAQYKWKKELQSPVTINHGFYRDDSNFYGGI